MKRLVAVALLAVVAVAAPAVQAEERHDERRERHEWRFERDRGWRFEHRPGVWSPYYVWWWTEGKVVLLPAPTSRVVYYSTGRYELRGDGVTVPFYWVWVPSVAVVAAPPPPGSPPSPGASGVPPPQAGPSPPGAPAPPPGSASGHQEWRCDGNGSCQWMTVP